MLGIPVSSTLQSAVKQVAISSGQILVAKGNPSVSKVMGGKQVLAQGVAKAIVSGASGMSGQQAAAKAAGGGSGGKSGGQSSNTHLPHQIKCNTFYFVIVSLLKSVINLACYLKMYSRLAEENVFALYF